MKKSLLFLIIHFFCGISRAQEPLAIHLKDFHTSPITDVLVDADERYLYSGDQSGKILVIRTLDYSFHKTLLEGTDGMAIKDMRLTNHDSILLILKGHPYALGQSDSLLFFSTTQHRVVERLPVHNATLGSDTDGLLLVASGNGQANGIVGFENNDLAQNTINLSCMGIPKLPVASPEKHWIAFVETSGNLFEEKLKVMDYTNNAILFEEPAQAKNETEIIFLLASVDGKQLYAFIYEEGIGQLSVYVYDLTNFSRTKLQSFPFTKIGPAKVEYTVTAERSVFVISDNGFGQQPLVLTLSNHRFEQLALSLPTQIHTGAFISTKQNLVFWSTYNTNIDNLVRYFVYDTKDSRLLSQYPSEYNQGRPIASFLPNDNIWITGYDNLTPINKYYPSGTFNNRFGLLGMEDYLAVYHQINKFSASENVVDEQSGEMVFIGYEQNDDQLTARYYLYDLLADRIKTLSDQEAKMIIPVSYNSVKKRLLVSNDRYFDRAGYEPRQFKIIDPAGTIDLSGAFKHGVISNDGEYVMTVDSANVLRIVSLPDLRTQFTDTLANGDFRLHALDRSSFAIGLSKLMTDTAGCNQETRFYFKAADQPFQRQLQGCLFPEDIALKNNIMAAIFKNVGVIFGERTLNIPHNALPFALSLNDDASRMLLSYQSGKIEIYGTDSLRLLGTMYHPDQHAHIFFDNQGHYFSNIKPDDFIYATRNQEVTPLPASDIRYYNPVKTLSMLGRPQPDYVKTLAKALAIRQRYLPHISSTGTVRPEIKSVLINGDQSGASSDQQETDITVLTNQDIQTITLSLNGVSLPNITVQPNVNHRYDFKVTLSQAVNTLQVTVVDAAGTPSFTTEKVVRYTGRPLDADLYVLAVGVSDYQQSEYDLTFADKDALDFIKLYGGLADTEYKQYEDKFFGTRYQLIKNEPNEISSEIRDFRAYSAVTGLIPVDPRGEKWLEIHGDKALLWDFNTASKKEIRLPSKFRTEAIYGVNELLYIEPEGNGFYCRTDDSLHYYSFRTDSLYTHSSPFTANAWAALSRPILLNGGRWVYAEQHPLYRGWEAVDSITVHIATNDKEKWKEQTHHFVLPGSLMPTLQTATSSGDNLLFSTVADTAIYAEWNENVYHARKIPIPKQIEYGDILNISEKKQQISLLRHYFTEADEKNAKEENGYHHYTFDLSGKLQDSLQLSDNDYATKGIQMIDGNLYKIATLPPMAVSRNLFSANEDTLIANAGPASFAHIHTRYLVNEQATDTAIRESLQSFFRTTKPADQVVIFLAGHGVLDSAYNFHYAAHNMDFSRVRTHGVALQEIIEEISKSSANRKLLMIDACHSGNVFEHIDIDTTHMTAGQSGERGSKAIRSQTAGQIDVATVINTMFDNFTSSSGLTILSASAGTDVAYENPSLSNGAFTTAFLNTLINELKHGRILLDTSTLDQPVILTDPLINRIQKEVIQVTNRKQTPDIREINSDVQIAIW